MKDSKVLKILKQAKKLDDRKLARELRKSAIENIKRSQEAGILQNHKGTPAKFETPKFQTKERGGKDNSLKLYDTGPEHKKIDPSMELSSRSLSTRYSPDRVGVQARRISDGISQDPITNKVYDWNEGFTTDDGEVFNGGKVSLQTDFDKK